MKSVLVETGVRVTTDVTDRERTFADHISEQRLTRSIKKRTPKGISKKSNNQMPNG